MKESERFSFVFDGNSQVLDHTLLSPSLLEVLVGADFLHFNTPFPASLGNDPGTPLVASDHDALETRFDVQGPKVDYTLTVFHNNDGESNLVNAGSGLEDYGGVARFATVVADAKAAVPNGNRNGSILVSSGDNFLAGPEFNASIEDGVWYDAMALDMLGYDAIQLGNHDFDFGPDTLAAFIGDGFSSPGTPPYIAANLDFSAEPALQALADDGVIVASTVVEEDKETFGIVGVVTPNLPFISSPRDVVVDPDLTTVLQDAIDEFEADGVDQIILISHLQGVNEDIALAATLDGVDVMVAGGGDEVLANSGDLLVPGDTPFGSYPLIASDLDGTAIPVVTTAGDYKYLGALEVHWDGSGNVIGWTGGPIRVSGSGSDAVAPDPIMKAAVVDPVAAYLDELATTVVATSEVGLDAIRPRIRSVETNEGNLIGDAYFWQATRKAAEFGVNAPDVALTNGGGIRNNNIIPAGPITALDTFSMLPFSNFVSMVENYSRGDFKALLENAVSRVSPDGTSSGSGTGRFAQISGFTMTYDPNLPVGSRVIDVELIAGAVPIVAAGAVVPGDPLNIATNAFSASGGDEWFGGPPGTTFTTMGVTDQQALQNFLQGPLGGLVTAAAYPEDAGPAGSCEGVRISNLSGSCVSQFTP
jgi:5'-nucleotidase